MKKIFLIFFLTVLTAEFANADYLPGTEPLTQIYRFAYTYITGLAEYVEQRIDETQPGRTRLIFLMKHG